MENKSISLVAHHLINYAENKKLRLKLDNGITLCKECHLKFHKRFGFRNNNRKQIELFLK
jgi:5-methylcytosine-specific restriction endonuclease McrA